MTKRPQRPLAGLAFGGLVILMAVWQGRGAFVCEWTDHHSLPLRPAKTRQAFRTLSEAVGDPSVVYAARCEKGLTDQEIAWIATDFRAAGLDKTIDFTTSLADALNYRSAQQRWYLKALVEGFGLSPEQAAQATVKLDALRRQSRDAFLMEYGEKDSKRQRLVTDLTSASEWLYRNSDFMPWRLCDLSATQERISWKALLEALESNNSQTNIINPDFTSSSPFAFGSNPIFEFTNVILPLLKTQDLTWVMREVDPPPLRDLTAEMRHLHPAQLKVMLLIYPDFAGMILKPQENAGTE